MENILFNSKAVNEKRVEIMKELGWTPEDVAENRSKWLELDPRLRRRMLLTQALVYVEPEN